MKDRACWGVTEGRTSQAAAARFNGTPARLLCTCVALATLLLGCREREVHRSKPAPFATESEVAQRLDPLALAKAVQGTLQVVDDHGTRTFILSEILAKLTPRVVDTFDPYYQTNKRFVAVPLAELLRSWWPSSAEVPDTQIEFSAVDGYKVRMSAQLAQSERAFIAFFDVDHPPFAPITQRKADPRPLYLFWSGNDWTNLETHPRPWGIVSISKVHAGQGLKHVTPPGGFAESACAATGFQLFAAQCQRCHAINGEGGSLGPDLNIPRNILDYRAEADVRAYIKDPATFRYGNMPAHPHLSEADLDQLVCYLREMGRHKFDPRRQPAKTEKGS